MTLEECFRGKGCLITGAASGIGFAVSTALLQCGAEVFMADRDVKALDASAEQLRTITGRVHPMLVDVTRQEEVQHAVNEAASRHGRLDFLFNNAGIGGTEPIEDATLEHWRRIIAINLWGVIYGIDAALPLMRRQQGGHIVSTSSLAGLIPIPYQALYCTTKYAVVGLSESLRFELEPEGIHFSVVCPGSVATPIWGTPIIGEHEERKPPEDAIPADEAAGIILAGVANCEAIIALPDASRALWRQYWSDPLSLEENLRDIARQRRRNYQTKGAAY